MKTMLNFIPLIILLTIIPAIFALCCKLSAFILRRRVVSWKHSFSIAYILLIISIAGNAIIMLSGFSIHPVIIFIFALIIQISVGSWFLSQRASYSDGQKLGFRGGAEIICLFLTIIAGIGFILMSLSNYLRALALQA